MDTNENIHFALGMDSDVALNLKGVIDLLYELDYEEFTQNPEAESKKLMKFCELTWDKKCLKFYKRKDIISKTTSYLQIRKSVYKQSKNRYLPYKKFLQKYGNKYSWFI